MLVVGGAGAWAGLQFGRMLKASGQRLQLHPADALILLAIMFVVLLVHELGHVAGGRLAGMRFLMLTVGPLRLQREGARLRLSFANTINLWGGLAVMLPTTTDGFRRRFATMIAGGPLASLLLAALGGLGASLSSGRGAMGFTVLAGFSAAIFVVTMMPLTAGGFASDGGQLLALRRQDHGADLRAILATIASSSLSGTRPRDYDAHLIATALTLDGPASMRIGVRLIAALHALDGGADARPFFEAALPLYADLPIGQRQGYAVWLGWYHAAMLGDAAMARRWKDEAAGGLVSPAQRDLLDAAIAHAEGDVPAARAAAARGLGRDAGIDPGGALLVRDLLARFIA